MENRSYMRGFLPYALAAFLIGIVGGFSTVLGPAFVQDIGIAYSNTTWTALAQAMSTAACAPILGRLGDGIGRRPTLLLGLGVYTLGNLLTAVAASLPFMLVARFVVGIGTAAMSPVVMAYIVTEFPQDRIARGFSLYMLISSASVIFGPTLGSLMIAAYGWRWMLWSCVGICVAVLIACLLTGKEKRPRPQAGKRLDAPGAVFVFIFFSLLLCIPSFGQNFGWTSAPFLGVLAAAALSLGALIAAQKRAEQPILSGSLLRRRAFVLSVLALFLTQGLLQANMTNTIVFVNYTQPGNSVISGYAISVMYLGMSLGAVLFGPLADKLEPKAVLTGSLALTCAGCATLFLFGKDTPVLIFMVSLGILGLGLGGNGTVLMKTALSGLSAQAAGAGTGTYGLFRDLAAPFGVAVFVPMFTNQIARQTAEGIAGPAAAVAAIRSLAAGELVCAAAAIAVVQLLPKIRIGRKNGYETEE